MSRLDLDLRPASVARTLYSYWDINRQHATENKTEIYWYQCRDNAFLDMPICPHNPKRQCNHIGSLSSLCPVATVPSIYHAACSPSFLAAFFSSMASRHFFPYSAVIYVAAAPAIKKKALMVENQPTPIALTPGSTTADPPAAKMYRMK
jgi:hypothetical protein